MRPFEWYVYIITLTSCSDLACSLSNGEQARSNLARMIRYAISNMEQLDRAADYSLDGGDGEDAEQGWRSYR